jgi:hypothetical protein
MLTHCDDVSSPVDPVGTLEVAYDFSTVANFGDLTGPATGLMHVCLYQNFGIYADHFVIQKTTSAQSPDQTGTIIMDRVYAGTYYVMIFYDQSYESDALASVNDSYAIYNGVMNPATGDPYAATGNSDALITIVRGQTLAIAIAHPGGIVFGADGRWTL